MGRVVVAILLTALGCSSAAPTSTRVQATPTQTETSASPAPTTTHRPAATAARTDPPPADPAPAEPVPADGDGPTLAGCALFPPDNPWRQDVSELPVHPRSEDYVASIGDSSLHPDFGSKYGIPYVVVDADQPEVHITFTAYGDESDPGPYPVPLDAPVEAGSDRHVLVAQRSRCMLYELFDAERTADGWAAASGATFDLRSNDLRPDGWTSADAAGLPILPGLVRYDEVSRGAIHHALRFTAPRTQRGYIHPATHFASSDDDPRLPPMGLRMRVKRSYDISGYTGQARVVLEALKTYGMLLADNGSSWFVTGATDARWDDEDLEQLKSVPGAAFEAVDTGAIRS